MRTAALIALVVVAAPAGAQVRYTVTDLGTLPGRPVSLGRGVNDAGMVAGLADNTAAAGQVRAFRSAGAGQPGGLTDLGTLGGTFAAGNAINAAGMVAGEADTGAAVRAFRSSAAGQPVALTDLGTLPGYTRSSGFGINAAGMVAGEATRPSTGPTDPGAGRAFRSSAAGEAVALTDLGTLPGGTDSAGFAVNAAGMVAENSYVSRATGTGTERTSRAFRSSAAGEAVALADLGVLPGGTESFATGINAAGVVAGYGNTGGAGSPLRAFRSSAAGEPVALTDLGTLGGRSSTAAAVNAAGLVVGRADTATGRDVPFVYDTQMRDLRGLIPAGSGWLLLTADGISDAGSITGTGIINGRQHAYLLTPVPEPAAPVLAAAAAAAGGRWARRRRRA